MARYATLVRTGLHLDIDAERLDTLFRTAREVCPDGFPHDETRVLEAMRAHVTLALVDELRRELAARLQLPEAIFSIDRFSIQGAGPVSPHDDARNFPDCYFVIVVVHAGRLGIVDATGRALRHAPGEILLLDPRRKHALVPVGRRGRDLRCAPADTLAHDEQDQFMFLDFEVPRRLLRERFRVEAG